MISPESARNLPGGSVIIASRWTAYRRPTEPEKTRFWQVSGSAARLSDADMVRLVARTQADGDDHVLIIRRGDNFAGASEDDLSLIKSEVLHVLEDQIALATHGTTTRTAIGIEDRHRRQFALRYPRLARLIGLGEDV